MSSGSKAPGGGQKRAQSEAKSGRSSHRIPRVEREIREVIGSYLVGGFRGDLPGIVSVSRVIVSKDLRNAKVLVTMMGEGANRNACVKELQAHAYEIQQVVNQRLRMKHCPRLSFHYDTGYEHAMKVENILRDLERERAKQVGGQEDPAGSDSGNSED